MSQSIGEAVQEFFRDLRGGKICQCQVGYQERGDSVLEDRFWNMMRKTRDGWHGAADQLQIGRYRVDAIIDCDGKTVVVELDGKHFHDPAADRIRDAELLKSVDAVIRIPFAAMWYYRYATFEILGSWFPRFQLKAHEICTLSKSDLETELQAIREDEYGDRSVEDFIAEVNDSYDVYHVEDDCAWVGTPRQFIQTTPKTALVMRTGQAIAGMTDRIYEKAQCQPIIIETRKGAA